MSHNNRRRREAARRRRAAEAERRRRQEPPFVWQSEKAFYAEMLHFLVDGIGTEYRWKEFRRFFISTPFLSFDKKMDYLKKMITSGKYNWSRCRDLINMLPEYCDTYNNLIKLVVPLHFATYKQPVDIADSYYRQQKYSFILSIGEKLRNGSFKLDEFCKLLTAKPAKDSKTMLAHSFIKAAQYNDDFASILLSLFNECLKFKEFDQSKIVLSTLYYCLPFTHSSATKVHDLSFSIMHKLLGKGAKPDIIFELVKKVTPAINNFDSYFELLIALSQSVDKSAIQELIKDALVAPTLVYGHKNPKPIYTLIPLNMFGGLFYQLAKEELLPALKYSKEMKEAVYKHIESLSDKKECDAALLSIQQHDPVQVCDFFWKRPKSPVFFGTKPYLSKRWQKRIDAALPGETTVLEQKEKPKM